MDLSDKHPPDARHQERYLHSGPTESVRAYVVETAPERAGETSAEYG
jgi:hypothetical protein